MDGYISKPLNSAELLNLLDNVPRSGPPALVG
jgi:hypothetical protein